MRKNEYNSLDEFLSQYGTGVRDPANDKWFGLEFCYNTNYYCLDVSGGNFQLLKIIIKNGEQYPDIVDYEEIKTFDTMESLLKSRVIDNLQFNQIITNPNTILLGQD
ncbi:MAG: hypothetical protein K5765_01295 [Clostridia bacterium]|nr:hypothetical protein [Clostridia bacterium]